MLIEVFGPGCPKCNQSADAARAFLAAKGIAGEVVKFTNLDTMVARGILRTPAVFVDGEKVLEGRVLREKDLEAWLAKKGG
ncbi:MAG: thioredoxin family protein [Planctomycetes bacterium]|jgi:small redox-active disulfide protein 2|nr:thioredoxin family protein [Planctomycetota bacterium]